MDRLSRSELLRLPFEVVKIPVHRHGLQRRCRRRPQLFLLPRKCRGFVGVIREGYVCVCNTPIYFLRQCLQALSGALPSSADLACTLRTAIQCGVARL